jgi:hypothetical protein
VAPTSRPTGCQGLVSIGGIVARIFVKIFTIAKAVDVVNLLTKICAEGTGVTARP